MKLGREYSDRKGVYVHICLFLQSTEEVFTKDVRIARDVARDCEPLVRVLMITSPHFTKETFAHTLSLSLSFGTHHTLIQIISHSICCTVCLNKLQSPSFGILFLKPDCWLPSCLTLPHLPTHNLSQSLCAHTHNACFESFQSKSFIFLRRLPTTQQNVSFLTIYLFPS